MQYAVSGTVSIFTLNCTVGWIVDTAPSIFILSYKKKLENAQLHREEKNGSIDRLNVKQQSTLNYSYANEKKMHAVSTPVMRMNVFLYQILDSSLPFCARLRICYEGAFPDQRCCGAFSFSCRRIVRLRRVQERIRMMFCRHPLLCNCLILHCHRRCWHHYSGFL